VTPGRIADSTQSYQLLKIWVVVRCPRFGSPIQSTSLNVHDYIIQASQDVMLSNAFHLEELHTA